MPHRQSSQGKIEHSFEAGRLDRKSADAFNQALSLAKTVPSVMAIEARAAKLYWGRFDIRLEPPNGASFQRIGEHQAGAPSSIAPVQSAPRIRNAMLDYAYSIELGRLAHLHASGACLAIGFLHADKPGRMSLALDALEPLRPIIDAAVAKWIAAHKFAPGDFVRMRSGGVTLGASLSKVFAQDVALPQIDPRT